MCPACVSGSRFLHQQLSPLNMGTPLLSSRLAMNNTSPVAPPVCSVGHRYVVLSVDKDLCLLVGPEGLRRKMGSSRHGRAFGGGGFARTMELQRNRRRSALRKTLVARQSQQQAAAQEVPSFFKPVILVFVACKLAASSCVLSSEFTVDRRLDCGRARRVESSRDILRL